MSWHFLKEEKVMNNKTFLKSSIPLYIFDKHVIFVRADILGFTKISERFIRDSRYGVEEISNMIDIIIFPAINY